MNLTALWINRQDGIALFGLNKVDRIVVLIDHSGHNVKVYHASAGTEKQLARARAIARVELGLDNRVS